MKRSLPLSSKTLLPPPLKPRRLCIPSDNETVESKDNNGEEESSFSPTYQWDHQQFMDSILFPPPLGSRPLPSIVSILAVAPQHRRSQQQQQATKGGWRKAETKEDKGVELQRKHQIQASARTGKEMPLLREFFARLDDLGETHETKEQQEPPKVQTVVETEDKHRCALDQSSTLLTAGHHKRYRELLSELSTASSFHPRISLASHKSRIKKVLNPTRYKEFETLSHLFDQERQLYMNALQLLRQEWALRFQLGFQRTTTTTTKGDKSCAHLFVSIMTQKYQRQLRLYGPREKESDDSGSGLPRYYGKCCQLVSLQEFSPSSSSLGPKHQIDINAFSSRIIHSSILKTPQTLSNDWSERLLNSTIRPISQKSQWKPFPSKTLLQEDEVAQTLAREHKVDVILSSSTLLTLLNRPGHALTKWMLPIASIELESSSSSFSSSISKQKPKMNHVKTTLKSVVVVEDPILGPVTPRERLEVGFERAMVWNLLEGRKSSKGEESTIDGERNDFCLEGGSTQYVYTILTLPSSTPSFPSHDACTLLVRSENEIFDAEHNPIHVLPQLEYFPEQGKEECSTFDRARWLLLKIIQPKCKVFVVRIDPEKANILELKEKSMAHALSESMDGCDRRWDFGLKESLVVTRGRDDGDLTAHLRAMMIILKGLKTIENRQKYLLCLPGRGDVTLADTTVSFHKAAVMGKKGEIVEIPHAITSLSTPLVVDLKNELQEADCVSLSHASLLNCFRLWEWNHNDREPFCFPSSDKKI